MKSLLNDELFSDVTFVCEDGVKIKAHKAILASRCEVFRNMLTSGMIESRNNDTQDDEHGSRVIKITDTPSSTFKSIINYIYTDQPEFEDLQMVVNSLIVSDKYALVRLKKMCEWELSKVINQDNVIDLLHLSDVYNANELRDICLEYAVEHFDIVTKRKDYDIFKKLSKNTIVELLKRK